MPEPAPIDLAPSYAPLFLALALHLLACTALVWLARWWPALLLCLPLALAGLGREWRALRPARAPRSLRFVAGAVLVDRGEGVTACRLARRSWMVSDWLLITLTPVTPGKSPDGPSGDAAQRARAPAGGETLLLHRRQLSQEAYARLRRRLRTAPHRDYRRVA